MTMRVEVAKLRIMGLLIDVRLMERRGPMVRVVPCHGKGETWVEESRLEDIFLVSRPANERRDGERRLLP